MTGKQKSDLLAEFDTSIEDLPESVDRAAVKRIRIVTHVLDDSIRVPGTDYRIGVDPLIGAVPAVGDVISGGFSLYIVLEAARPGVSYTTLFKMIANVSLDVAGGTIPYVGEVFDAVWKANKRNLELVLEDLTVDHDRSFVDRDERIEIESSNALALTALDVPVTIRFGRVAGPLHCFGEPPLSHTGQGCSVTAGFLASRWFPHEISRFDEIFRFFGSGGIVMDAFEPLLGESCQEHVCRHIRSFFSGCVSRARYFSRRTKRTVQSRYCNSHYLQTFLL